MLNPDVGCLTQVRVHGPPPTSRSRTRLQHTHTQHNQMFRFPHDHLRQKQVRLLQRPAALAQAASAVSSSSMPIGRTWPAATPHGLAQPSSIASHAVFSARCPHTTPMPFARAHDKVHRRCAQPRTSPVRCSSEQSVSQALFAAHPHISRLLPCLNRYPSCSDQQSSSSTLAHAECPCAPFTCWLCERHGPVSPLTALLSFTCIHSLQQTMASTSRPSHTTQAQAIQRSSHLCSFDTPQTVKNHALGPWQLIRARHSAHTDADKPIKLGHQLTKHPCS